MERHLLDTGFGDDDGSANPDLTTALLMYDQGGAGNADVLAVLRRCRLLVPVVAVLGEVEYDEAGLARDKSSDMAAVLIEGADGRKGLLAFTSMDTMKRWNPQARPVPVKTQMAAQSALHDGAAALLVDLAGPTTFIVEGENLQGLAKGWEVARLGDDAVWMAPAEGEQAPDSP